MHVHERCIARTTLKNAFVRESHGLSRLWYSCPLVCRCARATNPQRHDVNMASSVGFCRSRLCFKSLRPTSEHTLGNLQRRSAAGWGWMRTRAGQRSEAALQRLVDFCCTTIADDQDRLDAVSEAELVRLLGVPPASAWTVPQRSRKPINTR